MARQLAKTLNLGDIGKPGTTRRKLRYDTGAADWRLIYSLLELAKVSGDRSFLRLACRIGDTLLAQQIPTGLFPRAEQLFARTGDQIPLALLHLAAALDQKDSLLPPAALDNAFFHCEFDGVEVPQKPGIVDHRTYDGAVFYGGY
jgi:hypothetical protein